MIDIVFSFNEKSSVLLIFFFNAIVFSILLFKNGKSENKNSSKWMSLFIFLGALYICPFMLGYAGWYSLSPYVEFMFYMPMQQLFLIGPVFYFYLRSLLNEEFKLEKKHFIHLIPAAIYFLFTLIVFITDILILDEIYFYQDRKDMDLDFWYQMSGLISMLFYFYLSLKHYNKYRSISVQVLSYADEVAYQWIKNFIISFSLILIFRVIFFITNPEWGEFGSKYWYYLCFSILLFYISISAYTAAIKRSIRFTPSILNSVSDEMEEGKSNDTVELSDWKEKIIDSFNAKELYKDPNLSLVDLANYLNTNRSIISKAINQEFEMNFNDFVNQKRAEAVIEKLKLGEHKNSTLLGIALDSGFNSKTTFNRAFKKYTGYTPKQYIDENSL